jgi:hypothetical protein
MAHAWATTNALAGLAESAFTFTNWTASNKQFLNDAAMDGACSTGTASGTTRYIDIDLGGATALVGFALLNHNIAAWSSTTIRVQGADDAGFSVNLVEAKAATTVAVTAPNDKDTVLQFPSVTKRYWRLTFVSSGTEALRLGELMALASITALSRLKAYGWSESEEYVSNRAAMRTGNARASFLAGPIRSKRLPFVDMQGTSQREELMAMWRAARGDVTPFLWVEQVESTATAATAAGQECLWGKLQPSLSWRETDYTLYDVDALELRSLGRDVGR